MPPEVPEIRPPRPKKRTRIVAPRRTGMSLRRFSRLIFSGLIRAVAPSIRNTLKILEPRTLPTATSAFSWTAPVRLTTSSGNDVPKPTITSPMKNSLSPTLRARAEAESTSQFAPKTSKARPMTRKMKFICVSFIPHIAEMIDNQSRLQISRNTGLQSQHADESGISGTGKSSGRIEVK